MNDEEDSEFYDGCHQHHGIHSNGTLSDVSTSDGMVRKAAKVERIPTKWLSIEGLSEYLGKTKRWCRDNILKIPEIKAAQIGKQYFWKVADIDSYLESKML